MSVLINKVKRWREDPVFFVRDQFGVEPEEYQKDALMAFARHQRIAMKASKGVGKTATLAWMAWNFLASRPDPKIAATSISSDNLSDGLWAEMAKWQNKSLYLKDQFEWTKTRIFLKSKPETWFMSARAWSKSASPEKQADTLAGLHADYILFLLDESGGIPDAVMATAEAALSTGIECKLVQSGNPTSLSGPLYRACTSEADLWFVVEITSDPDSPKRSQRVSAKWAREQINKYGADNPWVLVNVFGKFPPSSMNTLLGPDEVREAMERGIKLEDYDHAQKRLGVDCARFGSDSTIIFPRQGLRAFNYIEMKGARSNEIAARVALAKQRWGSEVEFVDGTGGFGSGVVDSLIQAGHAPIEVQFSGKASDEAYLNKRAEMWFKMAEWIKRGGCLPNDPTLLKELTTPEYNFKNGKFMLEPKEQIKERMGHSPDCFVAGTKVKTPTGDINIETVRVGDIVCTPFGPRSVVRVWESETNMITTALFGPTSLSGKGKHEVFTWNRGFVRLDALSLTDEVESYANIKSWNILRKFFTTDSVFTFKQLEGIILRGRVVLRGCYTDTSGPNITAQFQRGMRYIIGTLIGLMIGLKILSVSREKSIFGFMRKSLKIILKRKESLPSKQNPLLRKPEKLRRSGTEARKGENGTLSMGKGVGLEGRGIKILSVKTVKNLLKLSLERLCIAQGLVNKSIITGLGSKQKRESVNSVQGNLYQTSTGGRPIALERVQTKIVSPTKVYNLTLDSVNVYYANEVLVSNCADSLALTFAWQELPGEKSLDALKLKHTKPSSDWDPFDSSRY